MGSDSHGDMSRDTISLTYEELAARLSIDVQSARRRVIRSGWERTKGNDGKARVQVPVTVLPDTATKTAAVPATKDEVSRDVPATDPVMAETVSRLLSQLDAAESRADAAHARADAAQARADAAEERLAETSKQLEAVRQRAEDERLRAAVAEQEVKGLRETLAEARLPFWRRWLGGKLPGK